MARTTYAKAQKLSKREQDKVQALKADYLKTVYTTKQRLGVWKKWEFFRLLFIWAAWLTLIAGVVTGILR